jgi:hypothetical protein
LVAVSKYADEPGIATARIDVGAPVEDRLDEFPGSLPHRDEGRVSLSGVT